MKLYLAGPMRGYPLYNFPAFERAARRLRDMGHEVFSPAEADIARDGFDPAKDEPRAPEYYMRIDLPIVCQQQAIAVLPGWRKSEGACKEVQVAKWCGMPVLEVLDSEMLWPVTETVLEEAERLVCGGRSEDYGHPRDDFACIAGMWNAYLRKRMARQPDELVCRDVALLMILVKVAREANRAKRDSIVDIAGYCRCAERIDE